MGGVQSTYLKVFPLNQPIESGDDHAADLRNLKTDVSDDWEELVPGIFLLPPLKIAELSCMESRISSKSVFLRFRQQVRIPYEDLLELFRDPDLMEEWMVHLAAAQRSETLLELVFSYKGDHRLLILHIQEFIDQDYLLIMRNDSMIIGCILEDVSGGTGLFMQIQMKETVDFDLEDLLRRNVDGLHRLYKRVQWRRRHSFHTIDYFELTYHNPQKIVYHPLEIPSDEEELPSEIPQPTADDLEKIREIIAENARQDQMFMDEYKQMAQTNKEKLSALETAMNKLVDECETGFIIEQIQGDLETNAAIEKMTGEVFLKNI